MALFLGVFGGNGLHRRKFSGFRDASKALPILFFLLDLLHRELLKRRVPRFYLDSIRSFQIFVAAIKNDWHPSRSLCLITNLNYEQPGVSFIGCLHLNDGKMGEAG